MNYNILFKLAAKFESLISRAESYSDPFEEALADSGFKPIAKLNEEGRYTSFLGGGLYASVYEIEYNGKRAVAKITNSIKNIRNYKKVMDINKSAPPEVQKHLLHIYEVTPIKVKLFEGKIRTYYVIVAELLEPLNSHVREVLFSHTTDPQTRKYKIPDFSTLEQMVNDKMPHYLDNIEASLKHRLKEVEEESRVTEIAQEFHKYKNELSSHLSNFIFNYLKKDDSVSIIKKELITMAGQILRKMLGKKYHIPYAYLLINDLTESLITDFSFKLPSQHNVFNTDITTNYYGSLPEGESLIHTLKYLQNNFNFKWSDLNFTNVMERPGTKDIVISDLGEFE